MGILSEEDLREIQERLSVEYTRFIKKALSNGFTDEQADFLWEELQQK